MNRAIAGVVVIGLALVCAGCGGGPSAEEKEAFDLFALERQNEYPAVFAPSVPTSIKDYVLGGTGITTADYIVAGAFTGATIEPAPPGSMDSSAFTLVGQFKLHESLKGTVPATFDVNLGTAHGTYSVDSVVRGAGDIVLFLGYDAASDEWVLVDGSYALAQSDGGDLSMPLVPRSEESEYMTGVVDLADIRAMLIAGAYDPNGSLNGGLDDLGDGGVSDTQQDLIDRANDLAD
ncbi:MAG: hypothetical protein JW722_03710 [Demequinaceae bacterium]|nr:hypothetical protein [Demequinaceae bacterium]